MWCGNYFETGHVETIARYLFTIPIKTEHFILPIKLSTLIVFLISQRLVQICSNKPNISTILLWAIFIRCWTQTKTKTNRKCFKYSFGKHGIQGLQMWYLHDEEKDAQTKNVLQAPNVCYIFEKFKDENKAFTKIVCQSFHKLFRPKCSTKNFRPVYSTGSKMTNSQSLPCRVWFLWSG